MREPNGVRIFAYRAEPSKYRQGKLRTSFPFFFMRRRESRRDFGIVACEIVCSSLCSLKISDVTEKPLLTYRGLDRRSVINNSTLTEDPLSLLSLIKGYFILLTRLNRFKMIPVFNSTKPWMARVSPQKWHFSGTRKI